MKYILVILSIAYSSASFAGIETDRDAGECAAMLLVRDTQLASKGAEDALMKSDNVKRASAFSSAWIEDVHQKNIDPKVFDIMVDRAITSCRRLGIRPLDY